MEKINIPAIVMLMAGFITCIFNIINKVELMHAFTRLIIVLVIFYIIGLIANSIIRRQNEQR
ncbi:MAG TPA: hypothetical protein GXZ90_09575 [Clostridiales bacterium]|nr:hypothetical protein [Clostridiales bacterium]